MTETGTMNRPAPARNGRLMLCNIGRLGDTILRNSILESAFRTYATVDYICGPGNEELICHDSRLKKVLVLRNSLPAFTRIFKTALRHRYDGFIDLKSHGSSTSRLLAQLFRSRVKTGCNADYFQPFHRDARTMYSPKQHHTETMRRIGELAGLEPHEYKPTLALNAASVNWFKRSYKWERPFIFLNISATASERTWPVERWAQYVRGCGLSEECILVSGVSKDRELVAKLCGELPSAVAFQPRQFMDVAAAVNEARLVLTVDTGVVHACSALDRPIVAFYSGGLDGTVNRPTSTRRLVIHAPASVSEMDSQTAIAETLRQGLPGMNDDRRECAAKCLTG